MNYSLSIDGNTLSIVPSGDLAKNTQYSITLTSEISGVLPDGVTTDTLGTDTTFWFTSEYCPLFTSINRVKITAGPTAASYTDDTIYRMIYKNSLDVVDIYNVSHTTDYAYDAWGCSYTNVSMHMRRYVECKTAYDILALSRLTSSSNGSNGLTKKVLGDMSITYGGGSSGGNANDPNKLNDLYECWKESMRMIRNIKFAVMGYDNTSKSFAHPVKEFHHNRVVRSVSFNNSNPRGPWENHYPTTGYKWR